MESKSKSQLLVPNDSVFMCKSKSLKTLFLFRKSMITSKIESHHKLKIYKTLFRQLQKMLVAAEFDRIKHCIDIRQTLSCVLRFSLMENVFSFCNEIINEYKLSSHINILVIVSRYFYQTVYPTTHWLSNKVK